MKCLGYRTPGLSRTLTISAPPIDTPRPRALESGGASGELPVTYGTSPRRQIGGNRGHGPIESSQQSRPCALPSDRSAVLRAAPHCRNIRQSASKIPDALEALGSNMSTLPYPPHRCRLRNCLRAGNLRFASASPWRKQRLARTLQTFVVASGVAAADCRPSLRTAGIHRLGLCVETARWEFVQSLGRLAAAEPHNIRPEEVIHGT